MGITGRLQQAQRGKKQQTNERERERESRQQQARPSEGLKKVLYMERKRKGRKLGALERKTQRDEGGGGAQSRCCFPTQVF